MLTNKKVSLSTGIAIAISMVIGSGLFGLPGLAIQSTSPADAFLGWLFVITIMPAMIHIFCKLSLKWPQSGGIALYATKGLGEWSSGGISLLTFGTLIAGMPAFFLVGGSYLCILLNLDLHKWLVTVSIALAAFTTLTNYSGGKYLSYFNKITVLLVLLVITYIIFTNKDQLTSLSGGSQLFKGYEFNINSLWLASSIVFWAFQGWENMTFSVFEFDNPNKNIPRVFWYSFFLVSLIYIIFSYCVSLSSAQGLNVEGLSGLTELLRGSKFSKFFILIMVAVLVANANSWVYGSSRAYLSSVNLGVLPKLLAGKNEQVPDGRLYLASLLIYAVIIYAVNKFSLSVSSIFLATTQGFIILYGASILAFHRNFNGIKNRLICSLALISWLFLVSGFGIYILYSLSFFIIGVLIISFKR